ncbi:MAG: hypothetical protein BZY75_06450 [SAR202 cluster bacterium Io17-Chloro-G7]|nr:MAG: hypothetical protein BZY75_06450 [SAR202 cluster bacterium Io17-Chloro-G7]
MGVGSSVGSGESPGVASGVGSAIGSGVSTTAGINDISGIASGGGSDACRGAEIGDPVRSGCASASFIAGFGVAVGADCNAAVVVVAVVVVNVGPVERVSPGSGETLGSRVGTGAGFVSGLGEMSVSASIDMLDPQAIDTVNKMPIANGIRPIFMSI